ncbi:MAG: folate-binding protein [Alphaproteobacteria bacterium]|nr:folate-binding protein [Alphaproteobacteria bacterium]
MSGLTCVPLAQRGVLRISGEDARPFLQGLISNDVQRVAPGRAIYAALLTPQGKYLFDFLVAQAGDDLLLDVEAARAADLLRRLSLYRLRSKVVIADAGSSSRVFALLGDGVAERLGLAAEGSARALADGVTFIDPRLARLGARALLPSAAALVALGFVAGTPADYDRHRLALGVPDGSRDILVDKSFLLESNVEELHGVDFDKGCYVGQELTARTKFRGVVRKRLFRVDVDGPLPDPGTPILLGDKEAGIMRSGADGVGLALLRLEIVDQASVSGEPLTAGASRLKPVKPDWVNF